MRLSAKGKNDRVTRAKQRESGTAVDLFCGSGGLTLGLKRARFAVLAGVEIDSLSIETYRQNHPEVRLYESDIRLLDPRTVMHDVGLEPGDLDLLAGCPPCQGFSTIRTKNKTTAVEDARNELIFEFL